MPANFLHGVETVEIKVSGRPVKLVKSSVIGLVGTAPIGAVAEADRTINKPVLIANDTDAVKYFGPVTSGYTIPAALDAIRDCGRGVVLVVNVFDPARHASPADVTAADIIGGVDAAGSRTGFQAFLDTYNLYGFFPKNLIAPAYCTQNSVAVEMIVLAEKLRGHAFIDAPIGTTVAQAIAGRGPLGAITFNTSSPRAILCFPHAKRYDTATNAEVLEPLSQRAAGVMAETDIAEGYWVSPSNHEIRGIIGMERRISAMINDAGSEANLLNEAGIVTLFNSFGTGIRLWGNRSAAWPTNSHPENFINVRRTLDVIHESVEYAMLQFLDGPLDLARIDAILATTNGLVRKLIADGGLIDGRYWFEPTDNPVEELAAGHLVLRNDLTPPPPLERLTFKSRYSIEGLARLYQAAQ